MAFELVGKKRRGRAGSKDFPVLSRTADGASLYLPERYAPMDHVVACFYVDREASLLGVKTFAEPDTAEAYTLSRTKQKDGSRSARSRVLVPEGIVHMIPEGYHTLHLEMQEGMLVVDLSELKAAPKAADTAPSPAESAPPNEVAPEPVAQPQTAAAPQEIAEEAGEEVALPYAGEAEGGSDDVFDEFDDIFNDEEEDAA